MSVVEELVAQLEASFEAIERMLLSVADQQDWQPEPGQWSLRFVAGHLAQVELDCHLNRVWRIAAGERPYYAYYLNNDWDFSHYTLEEWLYLWRGRRQELADFVRTLNAEQLTLSGTHETFGTITVVDVLRLALEHDNEHFAHLQAVTAALEPEVASRK